MYLKNVKIKSWLKMTAAAALAVLFIFILTSSTFAWFEKIDESDAAIDFGTMEITSRVYFEYKDAGGSTVKYYPDDDGYGFYYVKVMPTEKSERDYLGNLRIDVFYKGIGANHIRVEITETWFRYNSVANEDETLRNPFTRYIFDDSLWIDNRRSSVNQLINDNNFYYNNKNSEAADKYEISYKPRINDPGYMTVPLIGGVQQTFLDALYPQSGTRLKIKVLSQTAQSNRSLEIWKITALPAR